MKGLIRDIDLLLRGQFTRREDLQAGRVLSPVRTLVVASLLLGAVYGVFMGLYSVLQTGGRSWSQLVATAFKVPLLFLLTLAVTFPSLYVFSAIARSRLGLNDTVRMLLAAIAVNLAVLASFGPVTAFFTLSTDSYPFMVVLNVLFFGIGGLIGIGFLRRALDAVFESPAPEPLPPPPQKPEGGAISNEPIRVQAQPKRREGGNAGLVFKVWAVIFGVVGAQMGWILRPFIGTPTLPFQLFRQRESNFFEAVFRSLGQLFS